MTPLITSDDMEKKKTCVSTLPQFWKILQLIRLYYIKHYMFCNVCKRENELNDESKKETQFSNMFIIKCRCKIWK